MSAASLTVQLVGAIGYLSTNGAVFSWHGMSFQYGDVPALLPHWLFFLLS